MLKHHSEAQDQSQELNECTECQVDARTDRQAAVHAAAQRACVRAWALKREALCHCAHARMHARTHARTSVKSTRMDVREHRLCARQTECALAVGSIGTSSFSMTLKTRDPAIKRPNTTFFQAERGPKAKHARVFLHDGALYSTAHTRRR